MSAFSPKLLKGDFFLSLVKKPSTNYDDLLKRVEKYINIEEAQKVRKSDPNLTGPRTSQPKHPTSLNGILRSFLSYAPGKQVVERTMQVLEGE